MNKKYVDSGTRISIDEQDLTGKFSIAALESQSMRSYYETGRFSLKATSFAGYNSRGSQRRDLQLLCEIRHVINW